MRRAPEANSEFVVAEAGAADLTCRLERPERTPDSRDSCQRINRVPEAARADIKFRLQPPIFAILGISNRSNLPAKTNLIPIPVPTFVNLRQTSRPNADQRELLLSSEWS